MIDKYILKQHIDEVESIIYPFLPAEEGSHSVVLEAMNYSLKAGGKRLRPMLMLECYKLCGGNMENGVIGPFMAALEMIHTYSLVHDDLPAMDNDELRRGLPTTWKKYGEAIGVLAGDGLLNYAFETALKAYDNAPFDMRIAEALKILAKKSGVYGMIGGQTIDVLNEGRQILTEDLIQMYKWKTGALIESSMIIGGILAGASDNEVKLLASIAENIGLAFQIQDDVLDITSTKEVLGKNIGSDIKNEKVTYVSIFGLENSKEKISDLTDEAILNLKTLENIYSDYNSEFLNDLIMWLVNREL